VNPVRRLVRWAAPALVISLGACAADPPAAVVAVRAEGCGAIGGVGAFVADGLVLTAAHTVAGATSLSVVRDGTPQPAEVAALDPGLDLALLRTAGPAGHTYTTSTGTVAAGAVATVWTVRDGQPEAVPVTVVRRVVIDTTDIYLEGTYHRPGLELEGAIEPGDSGAPVVAAGVLVGVVWARSTAAFGRAWAIEPVPVSGSADTTRCAG